MKIKGQKNHREITKQAKDLLILYGAKTSEIKYEVKYDLPNEKTITVDLAARTRYGETVVECGSITNDRLGILTRLFDKVIWIPYGVDIILNIDTISDLVGHTEKLESENARLKENYEQSERLLQMSRTHYSESEVLKKLKEEMEKFIEIIDYYLGIEKSRTRLR